jgi:exodeoxyribonuclease VII large subunit
MSDSDFHPIFQVSEFNELISNHLGLLGEVTIEGEITRIDVKNGRLIFGSIKDSTSSLDFFSMSHLIKNFRSFEPGMLVRVTGTPGVYKGTTKFRLMVTSMVPQGEGALQIAFEKLKNQLESEGLFAPERKRPIPGWATNIGLITAKNSSAYFDLIKILSARMPGLELKHLPVNVQGREAIPTILKAFHYINIHHKQFDVIILARGGGSLEDLQAFNSEEITRAVFSCKVPVISAIGHEDNWSLTDYVADLRASTPSNAAELAVRDRSEIIAEINSAIQFITEVINHRLSNIKSLVSKTDILVKQYSNRIDHKINNLVSLIRQKILLSLALKQQDLEHMSRLIQSLDYQQVLNRGFSITKTQAGKVIKASSEITADQIIITQLARGEIKSYVK